MLPVSSSAAKFLDAVDDWRKQELLKRDAAAAASLPAAGRDETPRVRFEMLMFNYRVNYMADTIGGFYFTLRSAEDLASACWHVYKERQRVVLGEEDAIEKIMAVMGPKTTSGIFETKRTTTWKGSPQFQVSVERVDTALPKFVGLDTTFEAYERKVLELFQAVIDVEVNRAFSKWYGMEPVVDLEQLGELKSALEDAGKLMSLSEHSTMMRLFDAYLTDVRPSPIRRAWRRVRA
jgi:hypothetical protein